MLKQYVSSVGCFSSQYGANNSISYTVCNIEGEPTLYPSYGDFTQACVLRTYGRWWKIAPEAPHSFPNLSKKYFSSDDFIELMFEKKVYIKKLDIYETYNPGAIVRILALDEHTTKWFVMWEIEGGQPPMTEQDSRIFSPSLKFPPFPSCIVRLEFNSDNLIYYTELDAVMLIGNTDVDVDTIELATCLDELNIDDVKPTVATQTSITSDNGHFDSLPGEVLFAILSYLSVDELCNLAPVSSLFYEHCYNPLLPQHQNLDLQPYWYMLDEHALKGFSHKCKKIRSLRLSWCGDRDNIWSTPFISSLIQSPTLSRLDVSCCRLNNEQFKNILISCQSLKELDVSSTLWYLSSASLQVIALLSKLTRLNLYMTAVDNTCIISITRMCQELEHINLGACSHIDDYNQVIEEISINCPHIKSLDLWRAKTLDTAGISNLAQRSKNLVSLDLGWCSRIIGQDGCLIELVKSCTGLKKIYLTANRSIGDKELSAIAKYCPDMEQLDLLGNGSVTMAGVQKVLKCCGKMLFLDLSFCGQITDSHIGELRQQYPKCSIKVSYSI